MPLNRSNDSLFSMRTIAIANQKGGVGKSSTAITLSAGLAALGRRVLLGDLDPQGHCGEGFGLNPRSYEHEMGDVLERRVGLEQAVLADIRVHLSLVPATIRLSTLEVSLLHKPRREDRLKVALTTVAADYDYAILDCPPSLGLLTLNGLSAADQVLVPMSVDYFSYLGVELLLSTVHEVQSEINSSLTVLGILPTRVTRTTNAREIIDQAREQFGDLVLPCTIPESVRIREAAGLGRTIFEHAPETPAARAYQALVTYVDAHAR